MIYFDNAATKPMCESARKAFGECLSLFGNPSSVHSAGFSAMAEVDRSRRIFAEVLDCSEREIFFTSGGTESDNWAVKGLSGRCGSRLVTTELEHPAVYNSVACLAESGFEAVFVRADKNGVVSPESIEAAVNANTSLVSVMLCSNELGTIQPVGEIADICKKRGVFLHTDAVQAFGSLPVLPHRLGVDTLALSAHKFGGPVGFGVLFVKEGTPLPPFIHGGAQQHNMRAGTESALLAAASAAAAKEAADNIELRTEHISRLRERFLKKAEALPNVRLTVGNAPSVQNIISLCIHGVNAGNLVSSADALGLCISSGSACSSGEEKPSRALMSIGLTEDESKSVIRISLGHENTEQEIDAAAEILAKIINLLR